MINFFGFELLRKKNLLTTSSVAFYSIGATQKTDDWCQLHSDLFNYRISSKLGRPLLEAAL